MSRTKMEVIHRYVCDRCGVVAKIGDRIPRPHGWGTARDPNRKPGVEIDLCDQCMDLFWAWIGSKP